MDYDVIFIDWYVTLSRSHYWEQLRVTAPQDYERLSGWLIGNMDIFNDWMRGNLSSTALARLQAEAHGLPQDYVERELYESCRHLTFDRPEVLEEIARLRQRGVKVIIATDNISEFSTITAESQRLNDYFDGILNSADLGVLKGDDVSEAAIPFFDDCLKQYATSYSRALLIDDSDVYVDRYPEAPLAQVRVTDAEHTIRALKNL